MFTQMYILQNYSHSSSKLSAVLRRTIDTCLNYNRTLKNSTFTKKKMWNEMWKNGGIKIISNNCGLYFGVSVKRSEVDYYDTRCNSWSRAGILAIAMHWKPYGCNVSELTDAQKKDRDSNRNGYVVKYNPNCYKMVKKNLVDKQSGMLYRYLQLINPNVYKGRE